MKNLNNTYSSLYNTSLLGADKVWDNFKPTKCSGINRLLMLT